MSSIFTQPIKSVLGYSTPKISKKRYFPFLDKKPSSFFSTIVIILFTLIGNSSFGQLNLTFGKNGNYQNGTGSGSGTAGAKYLYTLVNDSLDCIVTIKELGGGATLYSIDDNSGNFGGAVERFQPIITVPQNSNKTSYVRFNFQLIKKGSYNNGSGTNVVPADPVWFRAYDIDGDGQNSGTKEFVELSNVFTGAWVDAPSQLSVKTPVATNPNGTAYTISNSTINGTDISDDGSFAFNGFIYANTVGSWEVVGGSTVGSNVPDPSKGVDAGDRLNSWSFNYQEVIPGVDFGDAPASYNGSGSPIIPAYHIVPSVPSNIKIYLGSNKPDVDYDPSGNVSGTVDDKNNTIDDEDGFQSTYFPKYSGSGSYACTVSATNTSGADAYIYGYIDFDGNGSFDAATEISDKIVIHSQAGIQYFKATFSKAFKYTATSNNRYARFRIGSLAAEVGSPTGEASDGEVEDYRFNTALKISGTVYDDANGNTDNKINGTPKGLLGTTKLYAILLDTAGKVLQSVEVAPNGTYSLDSAGTNNAFKIVLSKTNPALGIIPSLAALTTIQDGYTYTSEGITAITAAGDKLASGNFSATTAITDITTMDFGWDALPETDSKSMTINSPVSGNKYNLTTALAGSDPEAGTIGTGGTFIIKTAPTDATLYYNNVVVTAGYIISNYDPAKLTMQFTKAGSKSFTYQTVDAAGYPDPTPATYSVNSNSVLPLNNIVLSANLQNSVVKLTLVAKEENKVARYTWEQSTDGTNFTIIGNIAYQATNASSNVYTFNTAPTTTSNIVYYRSLQYSTDGTTLTSNIVVVKLNEAALTQAMAMPTVIRDITNIKISSVTTQTISLNIVDNTGRMVSRKQVLLSAGSNTFAVDGWDRLSNGPYFIQIVGIDNQSVLKVIVQH